MSDEKNEPLDEDIWQAFERVLSQFPKDALADLPMECVGKKMGNLPLIEFEHDNQKVIINLQGFKMAECRDVDMASHTSYQLYLSWKHNLIKPYFWRDDKAARDAVYEAIVMTLEEMKQ